MNWDALGAMGEIAGAIAVITTLFFLARQLRMNTKELERTNAHQRVEVLNNVEALYVQIWQPILENADLAEIYLKGVKGQALTDVEELRFCTFINGFLSMMEAAMNSVKEGVGLEDYHSSVESLFDQLNPYLNKLLSNPTARNWLDNDATGLFSDEFVASLNEYGPLKAA